jgi:hypothetical protein
VLGYGARIINRESPPTWEALADPVGQALPYGERGEHSFGWVRHNSLVGLSFSFMHSFVPAALMEIEVSPLLSVEFVDTSRVPSMYKDVLGAHRKGDLVTDVDGSLIVAGTVSYKGWHFGGALMAANVVDTLRRFPDELLRPVQSVDDGGNLLLLLNWLLARWHS